jgi:hypothetical protein
MAHINKDAKCRTRAAGAVVGVLRCSLLGAHRLPGAGKDHGECDNSDRCDLKGSCERTQRLHGK